MSHLIEQAKFSCALGGLQTVLAIEKGIPIVHAGPGCAARQFSYLGSGSGYQGEGYAGGGQISCTNSTQSEVIFGGEKKLRATVDGTLKVMDGSLYVILAGCSAGIIGDDVKQIACEFADEGYPVVGVDTAGFRGNNYQGHELVVNAIIDQYISYEVQKANVRKGLVNVFSVVPFQDAYWRGDLHEIKRLLEGIGLEVNILYGPESKGFSEWMDIPNAEFNLVLSPWVGLSTAKKLESLYKTPYLHVPVLPVGLKETGRFLRKVAEFASLDKDKVESFIASEEKQYKSYFVSFGDLVSDFGCYLPYHLYTIADSTYGIGTSKFVVEELGFTPKGFYDIENPDTKTKQLIEDAIKDIDDRYDGNIVFEGDNKVIQEDLAKKLDEEGVRSVVLGSSWDKELVTSKNDSILIRLSLPITDRVILNKSYVGYKGALSLIEDIYSGLFADGMITNTTHADH
jgi:nitrogenase molybdenum-iron protein beta chain